MHSDDGRHGQPTLTGAGSNSARILTSLSPTALGQLNQERLLRQERFRVTGKAPQARRMAEEALSALYREIGLPPPQLIVWMTSPRAGAMASFCLKLLPGVAGPSNKSLVLTEPLRTSKARVLAGVAERVWTQVAGAFATPSPANIRTILLQQFALETSQTAIFESLFAVEGTLASELAMVFGLNAMKLASTIWTDWELSLYGELRRRGPGTPVGPLGPLPQELAFSGRGAYEDPFLATLRFCEHLLDMEDPALKAIDTLSSCTGAWFPFERAVILTESPTTLTLDSGGLVDSKERLAIEYADGFRAHAVHGIHLSADLILPGRNLPEGLAGACEGKSLETFLGDILGPKAILEALQSRLVSRSDDGSLHVVRCAQGAVLSFLKLPTLLRGADGLYRDSLIRIPNEIQSVSEALKWLARREGNPGPLPTGTAS